MEPGVNVVWEGQLRQCLLYKCVSFFASILKIWFDWFEVAVYEVGLLINSQCVKILVGSPLYDRRIDRKQCYVTLWTIANRNTFFNLLQNCPPTKSITVKCMLYLHHFRGFTLPPDSPFQQEMELKVPGSMLSSLPPDSIDKSGYFTSQDMGVAGLQLH